MSTPQPTYTPHRRTPGVSGQVVLESDSFLEHPPTTQIECESEGPAIAQAWTEQEEGFDREKLWAGKIIVDNTRQFKWIVYLKNGMEICFADREDIFVAGDLLWLPDENDATVRLIPDAMVVVGRPAHDRSSYKQWEEENIAPQVVFEVLSPSNNAAEMKKKRGLYERYGVEEFYLYEPMGNELSGYARGESGTLEEIEDMEGWKSPRLGITFRSEKEGLRLYTPEQEPILSALELAYARRQAEANERDEREARYRAEAARHQAEAKEEAEREARHQAEAARQQAEEKEEAERQARHQAEMKEEAERHARQQAEAKEEAERQARHQAEMKLEQLQQELDTLRQKSKRKKSPDK